MTISLEGCLSRVEYPGALDLDIWETTLKKDYQPLPYRYLQLVLV